MLSRLPALLLLALGLSACASRPDVRVDPLTGFAFPPVCQNHNLLADTARTMNIVMVREPQAPLTFGDQTGDVWRPGLALVSTTMDPFMREATLNHEACHELMYRLNGAYQWHPVYG